MTKVGFKSFHFVFVFVFHLVTLGKYGNPGCAVSHSVCLCPYLYLTGCLFHACCAAKVFVVNKIGAAHVAYT